MPLYKRHWTFVLAALALLGADAAPARPRHHQQTQGGGFNVQRSEIVRFVDQVAARDALDRKELLAVLMKARRVPAILEAMSAPAEAVVPWYLYRERLLTPERIAKGVQFWLDHRQTLDRIAATQEVPAQYLVAILGVETQYGHATGKFRVLDVLATLAFDYPPRAAYFRDELEQFLLLTHEDRLNPLKVTGSYAGAMGAPQFMPSAYRRYAVDGDGDHRRDLWDDWDDILASVANFFKEHGWEAGGPVLAEATVDPGVTVTVPTGKLELTETVAGLAARGIKTAGDMPGETPALLIPAETREGPAYRVGFKNFFVITRYNRSVRYAMAVHDLAQRIAQEVEPPAKPASQVAPAPPPLTPALPPTLPQGQQPPEPAPAQPPSLQPAQQPSQPPAAPSAAPAVPQPAQQAAPPPTVQEGHPQ